MKTQKLNLALTKWSSVGPRLGHGWAKQPALIEEELIFEAMHHHLQIEPVPLRAFVGTHIQQEENFQLATRAERLGRSKADLIREAIRDYLLTPIPTPQKRLRSITSQARSTIL